MTVLLQAWHAYGLFCMRRCHRDEAEECFVTALGLLPQHASSLYALACLSLHQSMLGQPGALERAIAAGHSLKELQKGLATPWALLSLAYKLQGLKTENEKDGCTYHCVRGKQGMHGNAAYLFRPPLQGWWVRATAAAASRRSCGCLKRQQQLRQ